jgi:hypothetical protein
MPGHVRDEELLVWRLSPSSSWQERLKEGNRKNGTARTQQEVAAIQLADRH